MTTLQLSAAVFGFLVIVAVIWNILKRGIPKSDGEEPLSGVVDFPPDPPH
jgi:hypothetical protein